VSQLYIINSNGLHRAHLAWIILIKKHPHWHMQ